MRLILLINTHSQSLTIKINAVDKSKTFAVVKSVVIRLHWFIQTHEKCEFFHGG